MLAMLNRPPSAHDDIDAGYRPGSLWLCDTGAFVALRVTSGLAVWRARHFVPGVLDQLHGPKPLAAYGMTRLSATAAPPCIDVVRPADGATLTIGFTADGALDRAALARFLGEATGRVVRWYDQSGHGLHAIASLAAAPTVALGRAQALVFDGMDAPDRPGGDRFMEIPRGLQVRLNHCSAFACGRSASSQTASVFFQLGARGATDRIVVGGCLPGSTQIAALIGGRLAPSSRFPIQSLRVAGVTTQPDRAHVIHDEDGFTTITPLPATTLAGGFIGGCDLGLSGGVELASVIVLDGPVFGPGDSNHDAIRACQYTALGIVPQTRDVYVADGDSITEGMGATGGDNYPRQMEALLTHPARIYNCGLSGDTLAGRDRNYAHLIAPLFGPRAGRNVLSIFAGTNDLALGASAASLAAHLRSYCARARATGFEVIVATTLPRPDLGPAQQRELHTHNAFVRQEWRSFCDGVADMEADPDLASRAADPAYFADGLHPTSLGYAHIAQIMAAAVNSLVR